MKTNFDKYFPTLVDYEGSVFEEHPKDPGGPTKFGITIYDIGIREGIPVNTKNWRKLRDMVKSLTRDQAKEIYITKYWNSIKGDELPSGIDIVICDHGINCGQTKAIRIAQEICEVTVDGKIGKETLEALKKQNPTQFIKDFSEKRRKYYKSLKLFKTFGRGWLNRVDNCEKFALKLI